ncbi:uncharacterized protein [Fopius arisanus]|uniref:Uncharacterized protein n=1 Tax=Fopius arisanus TaxID=64838 RepID=A0A9R1TGR6_9HYME|nr:PREDICTED: uncharacterized protein LOC105269941 [Fopius arisanus]
MIVAGFWDFLKGFFRFFTDFYIDFDFGSLLIVWVTFLIISAVSAVILWLQTTSESSGNRQKSDRISRVVKTEFEENNQKSRIMIEYRRSARELHTAAERCYQKKYMMKCIDIVSKYPPLVNVKCPISGLTPFHQVCFHRNSCLVSFMLGHGADPSITTDHKENALCLSIRSHLQNPYTTDFSCLKLLQGAGCFLDRRDKLYLLFLQSAVLTANKPLVLWILKQSPYPVLKQQSFS